MLTSYDVIFSSSYMYFIFSLSAVECPQVIWFLLFAPVVGLLFCSVDLSSVPHDSLKYSDFFYCFSYDLTGFRKMWRHFQIIISFQPKKKEVQYQRSVNNYPELSLKFPLCNNIAIRADKNIICKIAISFHRRIITQKALNHKGEI